MRAVSGLVLLAALDGALLLYIVSAPTGEVSGWVWSLVHAAIAVAAGLVSPALASLNTAQDVRLNRRGIAALCFVMALALPFLGILGVLAVFAFGIPASQRRDHSDTIYHVTPNPDLPYTLPTRRVSVNVDTRSLADKLSFVGDAQTLYRSVLVAGRIPSSLGVEALRLGTAHDDDRVRLTAYQTLDRKVTELNDDIDRVTAIAKSTTGTQASDLWLQVASNFWELLSLQGQQAVAREQLLDSAARAATASIAANPDNRNAHFTLGRIALRQGRTELAEKAFAQSTQLGMPSSVTLPWRAETAFVDRDFSQVRQYLGDLGDAFKRYPPLRQVTEHWL